MSQPPPKDTTFERWAVVFGVLLLAFNLRPAAVSVGPLLAEVKQGLGMGDVAIGMLTSLPVVAFAVFGALAPVAAGEEKALGITLIKYLALDIDYQQNDDNARLIFKVNQETRSESHDDF